MKGPLFVIVVILFAIAGLRLVPSKKAPPLEPTNAPPAQAQQFPVTIDSSYPVIRYFGDQVDRNAEGLPMWTNRVFGVEVNGSIKPLFKITK